MSFEGLISQLVASRLGGVGRAKDLVTELLSLDGVAEAPDGFFGWDDAVDA
jgi:hypothetical protein